MRFSYRHNFIFLANPKTGTTSVEKMLRRHTHSLPVSKHASALEVRTRFERRKHRVFFDNALKFAFTRNPWDRVVSLYEYTRRAHGISKPFSAWVLGLRTDRNVRGQLTSACSFEAFAKDEQGQLLVNEAIKLEDIAEQLPPLLERLSVPVSPIPKENAISHDHYREYYDDETQARVAALYAADIERFGYVF